MLRILKRSTAIPADFDAIDSPDSTLNKDDDHVDQIQQGRQWPHQRGTMLRILKRSTAIPADFDAIDSPDGSRPYFRTLRGDPEMIPLSLQNRMLLRSSKR